MSMFRTPQVILFSENLPRAIAFYTRLGFTKTFWVPLDGEPIHVDLTLDGYMIGIASVESTRDDHGLDPVSTGQRAAVILWTDDTAAAFADLTAEGAPALASPHEWLGRLLIAGSPTQTATRYRSSRTSDSWSVTMRRHRASTSGQ
jgi:uncharacterized glyoxalase superfamily protein PhnB